MLASHWIALAGWILGWILFWRLPRLARLPPDESAVPVTIVVPARNESERLPALLRSLVEGLPDGAQVIVVDDHSTDGTADVARRDPRVRVVTAPDLPAGWTGKPWACQVGAGLAEPGDLVFVDADVEVGPTAIARVLATRRALGGLVSIWPYHRVVHRYEHFSALFNVATVMALGAASLLRPRHARVAVGPMIATTTADYAAVGGHASVRSEVVEDLGLGQRYADANFPVTILGGGADVSFRMYGDGMRALVRGWAKSFGCGPPFIAPLRLAGIVFWIVCAYGAFMWAGGLRTLPNVALTALFAVQMGVLFRQVGNFNWLDAVLYPVHLVFFTAVFLLGIYQARVRRSVHWRGRDVEVVDAEERPG
jgi:4,4'-diaponeurosporenoate glycosyltransferase